MKKNYIGIMFVKYSVFYGILVLCIFVSMLFFFVLCDGLYYCKEIKWLLIKRLGGIKKKVYFVIDERFIMCVYLYLENEIILMKCREIGWY